MPNLEGSFTKIDVPGDGSCLFWAVTLAYLTPVKNDDALFRQRYEALFGNEEIATQNLDHIRNLVENYNTYDDTFVDLVRNTFRNRVVDHIRSHEEEFRAFVEGESGLSFDNYLQDMRNPNAWGGEPEIRAMSEMLGADISVSGASNIHYDNGDVQIQLFHVGTSGVRNHYNFGLEQHIVDGNEVGRLQNSLKESIRHYQTKPQDFELIQLLIQEADSLRTSTSTRKSGDFGSFQERFQSYIDQIPSYLHSVEKPGFFSHFFLGSFSTLLDTKIAEKLSVKKIYFSFDTSKTLKVVVVKNGQIGSAEDAINNINLFSISEGKRGHEFTSGELENILKENIASDGLTEQDIENKIEEIKNEIKGTMKSRLVQISKGKDGIFANTEPKEILDSDTSHKFHEIEKGLWTNPEDCIAGLSSNRKAKVKESYEKVFEEISKVHSKYEDSLQYGSKAREAAHHGFMAGALNNFRYRYNLRGYLEQLAGRGYADIGLLARGPDRALNAIPFVIEMKAATVEELRELDELKKLKGLQESPDLGSLKKELKELKGLKKELKKLEKLPNLDLEGFKKELKKLEELKANKIEKNSRAKQAKGLEQAKEYAENGRFLTTSDIAYYAVVNFDSPSPISNIEEVNREGGRIPFFQDMLESVDDWHKGTEEVGKRELKKQIKDNLERIYNTFPGTGEKGDNHYFSRFLLGQSLLLDEVENLGTKFEKRIFIYEENIPTEIHPESGRPQRPAAQAAKAKLSTGLGKSHAVVSMVLIPENDEKLVYVINIVEANRKDVLDKTLPLNKLRKEGGESEIGEREIVELNLNFDTRYKSNFERYLTVEVSDPVSLEQYNARGVNKFQGAFKKIPYPDQLRETFDRALDSQFTSSKLLSIVDEYKKLSRKIGEGILPFRVLIGKETDFQGVLHGVFSCYGDLKSQESPETRALVLTEFQTGKGKRVDMVVHALKFKGDNGNAKECVFVGFELKTSRQGKGAEALLQEAIGQIKEKYRNGVTYKTLQDGDEVIFIAFVFNKGASDADSLILVSKELIRVKVVRSSTDVLPTVDKTVDKLDLGSCLGQGDRKKRSTNGCLFSWDDVDKFNSVKDSDKRDKDKIKIDDEKFLTYIKDSQDEGKNAQLVEFIGEKITPNIESSYKYLLNEVVQDGGYVNYAQNRRIRDLQSDVLQQNDGLIKSPKLKSRLMNAAGGIQLIRGIHGAIISCTDGTATDCGLNLGGIAWSFASQPIENVMVKITPKLVKQAESVAVKVISGTLSQQTKFAIRVVGVKFGTVAAKGGAGALSGVFDIVDIGRSVSNLVGCKNRESSDNPCEEKEIRDDKASISFSSASFVSGVGFTAAGMTGVGILVGLGIMVSQGVYSGVSNIIEYEKKYDTTHDENWRIFWHTFAFQPIPVDVQHLAARHSIVNSLAQEAWKVLSNSTSDVVAYGIGFGEVSNNAFRPSNAKIFMNRTDVDTTTLSRVIPDQIQNATAICLPQITHADYEKGWKKSVLTAIHYCDNAMVIADERRKSSGKTVVYDLRNIDKGVVVGSNKLNNDFLIFQGAIEITGGNNVVNRFAFVNNPSFLGKVIGGSNSTNILDLSQLKDKVIKVNVSNVHQSLKVKINDHLLINDSAGDNLSGYHYAGRQNKVDKILCTDCSQSLTVKNNCDVMIDSGGGFDNDVRDTVENCEKVIVSPYTTVKGRRSNYTFYVKTAGYRGRDLHSEINVEGTGTVSFLETDLLSDCDKINYSSSNNTLSLKIKLDQDSQYTLDIKNYKGSNKPNFILIDKNGSNIVPKIGKSESPTAKIDSFELHTEYPLDNFDDVENHYKKVLNDNKDYKVFGVVRDKVQDQDNGTVPHMVFGSSGDDIVNFDQATIFARGGKGHDIYVIGGDIGDRKVIIDNNSDDKKLDVLSISEVPEEFSIQQRNLHLNYGDTHIQVKNYLQDNSYRHLMVMNSKGETFIPYMQSILHADSSSVDNGKLVPFFHATETQNIFLLPKDFQDDHVVIDSRLEDIEQYRDKDDLLLIRESGAPFILRVEGYYGDREWRNVDFLLWNNGNFSYFDLPQEVDEIMSYQDKLKADYEKVVKEYVINFNQSVSITHNQKDDLTSVEQDEERIGVIVLKGITPDQVKVSFSGSDLVFRDTESNHMVNVRNWDSSESHRISALEFDLDLDPIIIRRLNRFISSDVAKMQTLIDKASENYQNRADGTETENDFKCLVSVNGFQNGNKTYECLGFSSLQDQINFTENFCSQEQITEFKGKISNGNQVRSLLKKLKNDLLLNGYDQNVIDQCNKLLINSGLKMVEIFKDEIINQENISPDTKEWAESRVSSSRDSIKSIAKKELKNGMFDDNYAFELANKVNKFDEKLFGEVIKEVVNDVYGEIDTKEMLKSVRSYNSTTQNIQGYVAIFDKMKRENDLNNAAVVNLAFDVKGVIETSGYSNVNSEERSELERIKKELPESVRNWVFSSKVCIKNVPHNEYLHAPCVPRFIYNYNRGKVFTWIPKERVEGDEWEIKLDGDNYYIKNVYHDEFLYAASDDFNHDSDRRRVFTWIPKNESNNKFRWNIEPNGDNCYIRNVHYNEYLYAASDGFNHYSNRREIFTWIPEEKVGQGVWKIEDCGSTRKRRNTQKSESKMSSDSNLDKRHHSRLLPIQEVTSSAARPSSWINVFANTIVDAVKGVAKFIFSSFKPAIDMQPSKAMTTQGVDVNGTLLLLDVFIRKITGQKYISTADQPTISLQEAECHASDIINGFEKVLKETAVKSGISVTNLNFDPIKPQSAIVGQLRNGEFSEISKILYSSAKQACPECNQTKRFLGRLETCIEGFLDKKELSSIGQKLRIEEAKQIRKQELCSSANFITDNPKTYLSGPTIHKQLQGSCHTISS